MEEPLQKTEAPPRRSDTYVAVIFVHGMGPQARHENVGQLMEALEEHYDDPEFGVLRNVIARTEPSRTGDDQDVPFIQFDRFVGRRRVRPDKRWAFKSRFRAYEAYWSPVTARGAHPLRVIAWGLRRLTRPAQVRAGTWRQFTRLRIARLHRLMEGVEKASDPGQARGQNYIFASLLAHIQRFRGHEGRRHERKMGTADKEAFEEFAVARLGSVWAERVRDLIRAWSGVNLPVEDLTRCVAAGLPLSILGLLLLLAAVAALHTLSWPEWLAAAIAGILLLGVLVAGSRFLAFTFSDVYIWNNNRDHDREFRRRQEVLRRTQALFEHVVKDRACRRVVIVSHSLGSAITLEALSHMGRRNMARAREASVLPIGKISHLFTLGSPIDKIFYFFQSDEAQTYRAGRLNDDLRGNLSQEPFFRDGEQRITWLNFWDPADPVSDPLYTPLGNQTNGARILSGDILNHSVQNSPGYSPETNHVGYLKNGSVIESIGSALFENQTQAPWPSALRDSKLSSALLRALQLGPVALLASAPAAALVSPLAGAAVALVPGGYIFVHFAISRARRWRRDMRLRRAILKVG